MSAVATRWREWSAKFAALSRRERGIVAAAVVLGGGFLIFSLGVDPFLVKARNASKAEAAARADVAQQYALAAMLKAQNADPDATTRARLTQARQQLAAVSERLARFEAGMVPPGRMQAFLEGLLARNKSIEVLGLKTLPVTLVGAPTVADKVEAAAVQVAKTLPAEAATTPAEGIFQHGIEIRLAGNYNDLVSYLADVEGMPQRVMWNSLNLTADKYPRNIMVLRVYTLSLDRNWLTV